MAWLVSRRILAAAALFGWAAACSSDLAGTGDSPAAAPDCVGPHCEPSAAQDAGAEQTTVNVVVADAQPSREGGLTANVLCGEGCAPDDRYAQNCMDPDAGLTWDVPDDGPEGTAGASGEPIDDAAAPLAEGPPLGCYVQSSDAGPTSVCAPPGEGTSGAPCVSSAACAPGFGCVGDAWGAGQCRRFCCSGMVSCDEPGTYCAERPLHEDQAPDVDPLMVPVCVVGDNCSLADPYPCSAGQEETCCPDATACTVVRPDGTTACVVPGDGQAGEPCPCAHGYVCSDSSNTCLRLCDIGRNVEQCDLGHCQWSPALPEGFGVCTLEGTR